jgi:hypothetical protein
LSLSPGGAGGIQINTGSNPTIKKIPQRIFTADELNNMKLSDLRDNDILDIKGKRLTFGELKRLNQSDLKALLQESELSRMVNEFVSSARGEPTEGLRSLGSTDAVGLDRFEIIDLRPMLEGKRLIEGDNLIHTTPSGLRFTAKVKAGEIIDWSIIDNQGSRVRTTEDKYKRKNSRCWKCFKANDGAYDCISIPCPEH